MSFPFNPPKPAFEAFRSTFADPFDSSEGLYPSNRNYGQFSTGGNLHETFRIDRYENAYSGHTTVTLPGGKKTNIDW